MVSGLSWSHIIIPIDLQQPKADLRIYSGMIDGFESTQESVKNPTTMRRIQLLNHNCKSKLKLMTSTLKEIDSQFSQEKELKRNKRQLGLGIAFMTGLATGSFITSLFGKFPSTTLTDILNQKIDILTTKIDSNSIQITQSKEDIQKINRTLSYINNDLGLMLVTEKELEIEMVTLFTNILLDEQNSRIDLLAETITQAFIGRLHQGLISTDTLRKALNALKHQAQVKGLLIGAQTINELYQLPTSFVYEKETKILNLILHVPVYRDAHILTLYRFVSTPIPVKDKHGLIFIQFDPIKHYLARNRDGTLTRSLTLDELDDCLSIGHVYFCDDQALEKARRPNCLQNLFSGINNETFKLCDGHLLPYTSSLSKVNMTSYLISDSSSSVATSECLNSQSSQTTTIHIPPGTFYLNINPNCTTSTENWVISPTNLIPDVITHSIEITNHVDPSLLFMEIHPSDFGIIRETIAQIGQPIPISHVRGLASFRHSLQNLESQYRTAHTLLAPTGLATLSIGLMIGIVIFIYFCRKRQISRRPDQSPIADSIPLIARQTSTPPAGPSGVNNPVIFSPSLTTAPSMTPTSTTSPVFQFGNIV